MDKLKLACLAGASAIANNKKLVGARLKVENEGSISFYQAEILLRLFVSCIYSEGIDTESLKEHISDLDTYVIERGGQDE